MGTPKTRRHQTRQKMSSAIATIIAALLQIGLRVLQALDARRADDFRRAVRNDPVGVLIDQIGGDNAHNATGVAQSATGNTKRDAGGMDG